MGTPILPKKEAQSRQTFLALMWALSHPGRIQRLPDPITRSPANFLAIGEALLDLETSFYSPDAALTAELEGTTAQFVPASLARFHFYPALTEDTLADIALATPGDMLYPDRSATLVLSCILGNGTRYQFSGPGILGTHTVELEGIPPRLWELRSQIGRYPLGWDLFFVDGNQVLGLPRTTVIQINP